MFSPEVQNFNNSSLFGNVILPMLQNLKSMQNKVKLTPFLRNDLTDKQGNQPVYLNAIVNEERFKINYRIRVHPDNWDDNARRLKYNAPSAIDFNRIIGSLIERINKITSDANCDELLLTKDIVLNKLQSQQITSDFIQYMEQRITHRHDIKESTKISHNVSLNLLKSFKPKIRVNELTPHTIRQYKLYLEKCNYSNNYVHNQLKNIKAYYNLLQDDIDMKLPKIFKGIQSNWHRSDLTFLTINELKKLQAHYEECSLNNNVRPSYIVSLRYYLFSCHTGLRISDINKLKSAYYQEGSITLFTTKQRKGKEHSHVIPLNNYAQKLWDEIVASGFLNYSDQQKRNLIKEAAASVGIRKKIKFHTSRHTCATAILQLGGERINVKELLDHSNIKTTMIYAHATKEDIKKVVGLMDAM